MYTHCDKEEKREKGDMLVWWYDKKKYRENEVLNEYTIFRSVKLVLEKLRYPNIDNLNFFFYLN